MTDWKTYKQLTEELGCSTSTISRMASLGQLERRKIRDGEHAELGCSPWARVVFRHVEPREVAPLGDAWTSSPAIAEQFGCDRAAVLSAAKTGALFQGAWRVERKRLAQGQWRDIEQGDPRMTWTYRLVEFDTPRTPEAIPKNACVVCLEEKTRRRQIIVDSKVVCYPCHQKAFRGDSEAREKIGI